MTKKVTIIVLVIVAISVAILVYKNNKGGLTSNQVAKPNNFTKAQAGNLISGFPQNLLLIPDAKVSNSYAYADQNQFTAVLLTSDSASDVYSKYMAYFNAQKYKIISSKQSVSIYANSPANDVSVQISKQKDNTFAVSVTYLVRKK